MSNSTRDQEITRRRLAGEAPGDLAREFDISPERVWQIVSAAQRQQRGEPPAAPAGICEARACRRAAAAAPVGQALAGLAMVGMRRGRLGRRGATKLEAYALWQGFAQLGSGATSAQVAAPARSIPPAAAQAKQHPIEAKPEPVAPALTPVHASQVQVVQGVAGREPLRMAARLGLNAERIAQSQPRLSSLNGTSRARNGGFHDQD